MTTLTIRPCRAEDAAAWDAFVTTTPQGTFCHRYGWKDVLERAFGHRTHYLLAEQERQIVGILPLAEINSRLFGHALISTPFCVYGGIVATNDAARDALDERAQNLAKELRVGHLEHRYRDLPIAHDWLGSDLYVSFRKELESDVEKNMLAIPRKQRAMVRKGIKNELIAEEESDVENFFALYTDNVHRHGTPGLPKHYFELLREVFATECEVLLIRNDKKYVSGVMSFYFRDEILPYYAGDTLAARELAANDFKYWELMRRACNRRVRIFDYGRSKIGSGSYEFKRNWGFQPQPLPYRYKLVRAPRLPHNNPNNPKFRLAIETWRRLPLSLANYLGPRIAKNLG